MAGDALLYPMSGVPRYVHELIPLLGSRVKAIKPVSAITRFRGARLAWEQLILPTYLRGRLLWSPANGGPLSVAHQVVTVHDLAALDHPEWFNSSVAKWWNYLIPRLAKRVHHIITVSMFTKRRLEILLGVPPERVTAVPVGVAPRFRPRGVDEVSRTLQTLGVQPGPYVLTVSTMEPRKNLKTLLVAWETILDSIDKKVCLLIAGASGSLRTFADHGIRRLPRRVQPLGRVPDEALPALYSGASAFVYPSLYEGFGSPPLEAMACGAPVVAGCRTSIPEVVSDGGVLVNPEDHAAIAHAIRSLLEDPQHRIELSQRAIQRAATFTWQHTADRTWEILSRFADVQNCN